MNSLTKYENHAEIIAQTVEQINKDFGTLLPQNVFLTGSDTPFNELYRFLLPVVSDLQGNRTRLMQLLYRIDIPESFMRKAPAQKHAEADYITRAILERELQKVVIRHNLGTGLKPE